MKLLNTYLLAASLALTGVAVADCGSYWTETCCQPKPCCTPCCNPCGWNPCCSHNFSLGAGGTYGTSGHLHGWGGFIEGNYNVCGNHFLGLQLTALQEKGYRSGTQVVTVPPSGSFPGTTDVVNQHREAKLDQFLLMLNYTYHGSFYDYSYWDCDCIARVTYFYGAGLGLNFARTEDYVANYQAATSLPAQPFDANQRKTHTTAAAQLFAGLGYAVTDSLEIFGRARVLFTEKFKFNLNPTGASQTVANSGATSMHTDTTQFLADMGANWRF